ncbi:unnamed protein product [Trypanosoma congolense IL3000]|uniref:WGS project CAEQ00000000 data, annotated contig 1848 n=1 Tax=Trypanosoma congolense (strain IL3000) TaxID=1068625 RepID=F9W9C5_TRYCI|nr:unnamed protein product [Trypanosoma congolense IL3000]
MWRYGAWSHLREKRPNSLPGHSLGVSSENRPSRMWSRWVWSSPHGKDALVQHHQRGETQKERSPSESGVVSGEASPRISPWTMQTDVGAVILGGIRNPEWVDLYEFLRPLCPDIKQKYSNGYNLGCLLRNSALFILDTPFREEVMQQLPRLITRLRIYMPSTIQYLAWRNITTLRDSANRQEHTQMEKLPRFLLRNALETAMDVPTTPFVPPLHRPPREGCRRRK